MSQNISMRLGDWASCKDDATAIRYEVFVLEQQVPIEIELDDEDQYSVHAVAYDDDMPVGTGRLLRNGHIGRMAVRSAYRGRGVGSRLLTALVNEARRRSFLEVALSAQTHALPFYQAQGFVAEGNIYMDAGIEHVTMRHVLTT